MSETIDRMRDALLRSENAKRNATHAFHHDGSLETVLDLTAEAEEHLGVASSLALISIAEALASIDQALGQLVDIALQAEDDLNQIVEAGEDQP